MWLGYPIDVAGIPYRCGGYPIDVGGYPIDVAGIPYRCGGDTL